MLKAIITGNIGADAEIKQSKSGREYLSFIVAHDRGRNNPTVWVRVSWAGGIDSPLAQYLKKGAKVTVVGDLAVSSYVDKSGALATGVDVYADSVDMVLFAKREEAAAPGAPVAAPRTATPMRAVRAAAPAPGYDGEDMPDFQQPGW